MTKRELKDMIRYQFDAQLGFMPLLKDIHLLESSGDGSYVRFRISVYEYVFRGREKIKDGDFLIADIYSVSGHDEMKL